ncbi:MAG: N-methyl-L-tryptophan oxidase [Candidatus Eremiobacteraeota bacterium]|nr:N-methyl-L-tryptophan oxidase [Candidatus Eremiobacteraeota bacterium]
MYDVAVLGLGGMGSAVAATLAARNLRVLGLEQFARGHTLGSSAGRTRMIRKAYFEDPAYVPMLLRAYELWYELQRARGESLIDITGILMAGDPRSEVLRGARETSRRHDLPFEDLDARTLRERYPEVRLRDGEIACFEPEGGLLYPEKAIAVQLAAAERNGAELRFGCTVVDWWRSNWSGPLDIRLADGIVERAERLAICAGPWLAKLAPELGVPLRIQRNVQLWFEPASPRLRLGTFPAFFLDRAGQPPLYGFPDTGDGLKAAFHGVGPDTSPQSLDRQIRPDDVLPVREALDGFLPGAVGKFRDGKACMYSLTPDQHFVIDLDPRDRAVAFAGGFSGHGFKFAPVVGELVAELLYDGGTRLDTDFLKLQRFTAAASA